MLEFEPKCICDFCSKDIPNYQDYYKTKNYQSFIYPETLGKPFMEHGVSAIHQHDHYHTNCRPYRNCHDYSRRPYHYCHDNYNQANGYFDNIHNCELSAYPDRKEFKEHHFHVECVKEFINEKKSKLEKLDFAKTNTCTIPFTLNENIVNVISFNLYPLKNDETNIIMEVFLNDIIDHNRKLRCSLIPDKYKNDRQTFDWGHPHPSHHHPFSYPVMTPYGDHIPVRVMEDMCNHYEYHNRLHKAEEPCNHEYRDYLEMIKVQAELNEKDKPPHLYIFENEEAFLEGFADIMIKLFYEFVEATEEAPTDTPVEPEEPVVGNPCPTCGQIIAGNCPVCGNEWPVEDEVIGDTEDPVTREDIEQEFEEDEFFN